VSTTGLTRLVQQYLHLYHVTGLGVGVQTAGRPTSSDLTPPDFTLWGFMKQMAFFQNLPNYVKDLSKTIPNAAANATHDALCYTDRTEHKWDICHTTAGYHNEIPRLIKLDMSGHITMLCTVLYIVSVHLKASKAVKLFCAQHLSHMHYNYIRTLFMRLHFNTPTT